MRRIKAATVAICEKLYPYTKRYRMDTMQQNQAIGDNADENIAQQILKVASLFERRLITKDEYEAIKQKLLL